MCNCNGCKNEDRYDIYVDGILYFHNLSKRDTDYEYDGMIGRGNDPMRIRVYRIEPVKCTNAPKRECGKDLYAIAVGGKIMFSNMRESEMLDTYEIALNRSDEEVEVFKYVKIIPVTRYEVQD